MRPPLYKAPLLMLRFVNSPLVALSNDRGISTSAEVDQRYARWIGALFLKKEGQKLLGRALIKVKPRFKVLWRTFLSRKVCEKRDAKTFRAGFD